jgi:hypothetical protein
MQSYWYSMSLLNLPLTVCGWAFGPPGLVNLAKLAAEALACPPGRRNGAKYKKKAG